MLDADYYRLIWILETTRGTTLLSLCLDEIIANILVRYLGIQLSNESNMTTGKIYKLVIVR
jgi:hypothetical protein